MNPADDELSETSEPTPEQMVRVWLEIEDMMCGRVGRARDIMKALSKAGIPIDQDTVEGLRLVSSQLFEVLMQIGSEE